MVSFDKDDYGERDSDSDSDCADEVKVTKWNIYHYVNKMLYCIFTARQQYL